ncbi:UNVERIFIED_CONTAM: hypothetical protein GTU68_020639 [Idotea baltica]|nr:hypothetical protein [Idotea baltica]
MHVSATDKGTGKEQKITIQSSGGLSDAEVEQMVKDAEENAKADEEKKESVEAKNKAEAMYYQTEKSLKEHGDKVSAEEKEAIEKALEDLKAILEDGSKEDLEAKTEILTQASMKLGEAVYKAAQEDAANTNGGEAGAEASSDDASDEKVVDAEFEEVDEEEPKKKGKK